MTATHCPNGHRWDSHHAGPPCPHCNPEPPPTHANTWANITTTERATLEAHSPPAEIKAYRLHRAGLGYKRIALSLDIAPETARDRVKRAERRLTDHKQEDNTA